MSATRACSRPRPAAPAKPKCRPGPLGDSESDLVFSGLRGGLGTSRSAGSGYRELEGVWPGAARLGEGQRVGRGSVTAAELVTPDGDLVRAGAGQEPDLFWAVRGAAAWAW